MWLLRDYGLARRKRHGQAAVEEKRQLATGSGQAMVRKQEAEFWCSSHFVFCIQSVRNTSLYKDVTNTFTLVFLPQLNISENILLDTPRIFISLILVNEVEKQGYQLIHPN